LNFDEGYNKADPRIPKKERNKKKRGGKKLPVKAKRHPEDHSATPHRTHTSRNLGKKETGKRGGGGRGRIGQ